jgi:hypothetical protein
MAARPGGARSEWGQSPYEIVRGQAPDNFVRGLSPLSAGADSRRRRIGRRKPRSGRRG